LELISDDDFQIEFSDIKKDGYRCLINDNYLFEKDFLNHLKTSALNYLRLQKLKISDNV